MTTIFDVDTEFEMQQLVELCNLEHDREYYFARMEEINQDFDNLSVSDWEEYYDIGGRDIPKVNSQIKEIEGLFSHIQKIKKMKHALVEHSLRIMYHPSRVARFIEQGVISFQDEKLWEL